MLSGPFTRKRVTEKSYARHKKNRKQDCEFCGFSKESSQFKKELKNFWVVENIFGYDIWDGCGVLEHLMLVPKRHTHSLGDFANPETLEYIDTVKAYEKKGYSIYSRSADNITKSIPHQHTHLIKLDNKRKRALLFLHKPHLLVYK